MLEKKLRRIPNKPVYPGFPEGILESMVHNQEAKPPRQISRQTKITIEGPIGDVPLDFLLIIPIGERRPAIFFRREQIITIDSEGLVHSDQKDAQLSEQVCREKRGGT